MRIIRTTVALLLAIIVVSTNKASANTSDTDTNLYISKEISAYTIPSNDPFQTSLALQDIVSETNHEKTAEEILYDKVMERWKMKQGHLWNNLPKTPFVINASAYTAAADECGKSDGVTASGLKVQEKRTLACPPIYPFGTKVNIEGMGIFTCEDRGGAIKNNHFDIYMKTKKDAFAFGRRNLTAEIVQ